jgi:hypothetical protein
MVTKFLKVFHRVTRRKYSMSTKNATKQKSCSSCNPVKNGKAEVSNFSIYRLFLTQSQAKQNPVHPAILSKTERQKFLTLAFTGYS